MDLRDFPKWKALAVVFLILLFTGVGAASIVDLLSGTITEALLDGAGVSGSWIGLSGSVGAEIAETDDPIYSLVSNSGNSGEVQRVDLDGLNADRSVYAALPFNSSSFEPSKLSNMSQSQLIAGEPLPEPYFPKLHDGLGYQSSSDSVTDTFDQDGSITLFEKNFETVKATTQNDVDVHMLKYYSEGLAMDIPAFFVDISDYDECFDSNPCDYQFILPSLEGSTGNQEYSFYLVSKTNPIDITTYINGEQKTEFDTAAQPYNLTVETEAVFGGARVEQPTKLVEREGNNLFIPSVSGTNYESEASVEFIPENGIKDFLVVPTKNNAFDYQMQVRVFTTAGDIAGSENLTVDSETIPSSPTSPNQLQLLDDFLTEYNQGVNALRPIADCAFRYSSERNDFYEIDVGSGTSSLTLSPGVPYVVNVNDPSVQSYRLEEAGSRLVFMPSLTDEFGNRTHSAPEEGLFSAGQRVLFTPTVNNLNDDGLRIVLEDGQGSVINSVNINAAQSVCGDPNQGDGSLTFFSADSDMVQRINTVRPILDAMFRAGN